MDRNGIINAALQGARVAIVPDCWPLCGKSDSVQVSVTAHTRNSICTLNQKFTKSELEAAPDPDGLVSQAVGRMAEDIAAGRARGTH